MEAGTRTSSVSSNGYQPDSPSEDDGYYTSAVSVQHKVNAKYIFSQLCHPKEASTPQKSNLVFVVEAETTI